MIDGYGFAAGLIPERDFNSIIPIVNIADDDPSKFIGRAGKDLPVGGVV